MTAITELAELEAAIGEADLDDDQAAELKALVQEGTPLDEAVAQIIERTAEEVEQATGEPDPSEGLEQPTAKMLESVARERERHNKRMHQILGGFVEGFEPCEKCDGDGIVPPGPKARTHPFFAACVTCNGFGQVLTGSLEEQYAGVQCPDCAGRGYLEAMLDNTPAVELVEQLRASRRAAQQPVTPVPTPSLADADPGAVTMGRPAWMGDPTVGQ